jgi:hypothetical protein
MSSSGRFLIQPVQGAGTETPESASAFLPQGRVCDRSRVKLSGTMLHSAAATSRFHVPAMCFKVHIAESSVAEETPVA